MNKIERSITPDNFETQQMLKADDENMQPEKGVQQSYKDAAHSGANVMFRAKVKGHKELDAGIPLHMTLKTFDDPDKMPLDEVKHKAEELDIQRPDPNSLKFEPITFTSPRNGNTYYMLKITGEHPSLGKFNEHFRGQGVTHDNGFMAHITIDKPLYDKIKTEGIKPHEVEFSPLLIEHGAGNTTHIFQDSQSHSDHLSDITPKYKDSKKLTASEADFESLQKGKITNAIAGAALATGIATAVPTGNAAIDHQPKAGSHAVEPNSPIPGYNRSNMLRTIASVESSGGKNTNHEEIEHGMHAGSRAYGKYGLTPIVIRETIKLNRDLKSKYGKASQLDGNDLTHFMQDNPGLEDKIADAHLARLEHHFGDNMNEIGYAWLNGVSGTYKAKKEHKDIANHWHVQKLKAAYKTNANSPQAKN